jgi:hypothetical protein
MVAPTITGMVASQSTLGEAPVHPFAHVVIGDVNANVYDTVTITMHGAGGTFADSSHVAYSSYDPVTGDVSFTLDGSTASDITSELQAMVFTAKPGMTKFTMTETATNDYFYGGGTTSITAASTLSDRPLVWGSPGHLFIGGSGDNFVFQNLHASPVHNPDTIWNFAEHADLIDLHGLDALVPGHHSLTFIGSHGFADFHHHHPTVWGMVRETAQDVVQVNVDRHLTADMAISVPGQMLHASDFIL